MALPKSNSAAFFVYQSPFVPNVGEIVQRIPEIRQMVTSLDHAEQAVAERFKTQIEKFKEILAEDVAEGLIEIFTEEELIQYIKDNSDSKKDIGVFMLPTRERVGVRLTEKGMELAGEMGIPAHVLIGMRIMNRMSLSIQEEGIGVDGVNVRRNEHGSLTISMAESLEDILRQADKPTPEEES